MTRLGSLRGHGNTENLGSLGEIGEMKTVRCNVNDASYKMLKVTHLIGDRCAGGKPHYRSY